GIAAYFLVHRYLPLDRRHSSVSWTSLDVKGTLLLSLTLGVYALSVTAGRAGFGAFNLALLAAAGVGLTLFVRAEAAAPSPLIHLALFRQPALGASLAMSSLVSTVMMATLVVGPFYLSRALALDAGLVGLAMAAGPLVAALAAMPSGRLVDRIGPEKTTLAGLTCIAAGCSAVSLSPAALGIGGYTVPLIVITAGYALFQTANNTRVMKDIRPDQRGVISGMLNLSRNLGLITGSSVMGAIFAVAAATTSIASADRAAVAFGMRATFAVSAVLVAGTLAIAIGSHARFPRDCASQ
ncbi:MAG TPA: MFS transporter, partial [Prosthecobacter sp.]|nr:MFS transporter [Prosthecobacter sp.]